MPRPSSFRAALAGLLTLGAAASGALAPTYAAPAEEPDPLLVHIDTISPELPRNGDVEITGTVTNVSDETFTRINLHAFSSQAPIPTATALAESVTIDPAEYVGQRVTVPGTFDTVDELEPGETASFTDTVPVELLEVPDEEGVYWIGIHALGDSSVPRDAVADGRARTFIPRRPSGDASQEASVILSVRGRVWYAEDGTIGGTERWARRLEEGGSLDAALDMADSAGAAPYSWLVDPAVLVALRRLSFGNPTRSIAPDENVPGQEPTPTEEPSEDEGGEPTESVPESAETLTPPSTGEDPEPTEDEALLATAAAEWLARFKELVGAQPVLTLPFGDLDVSAAVRNDASRYDQAVARSAEVMAALELPTQPAVAPDGDVMSPEAIAATSTDTVILLGDNAFLLPPTTPNSVVRLLGHKVVVTSTGAEAGGPGPTAATDPLALRQRLLSEAALRLTADDTAPLVVTLPTVWRGEDAASFFSELDRPWLDLVPVAEVAERGAVGVKASSLSYTETDREAELGSLAFTAAERATDASTLLERVLTLQTTIEQQVRDEVMVTLSEQHRARPRLALRAAGRVERALEDDLAKITVEAPTAVTLSSDAGPFPTTVVNGLDQPVTVQVRATTDGELTVTGDGERELGPQARSVIRYEATAARAGVHSVRLVVTSIDGEPLGSSDVLPVRAARVSALIWIVMALGALVLFGMIGYRLPGQIRQRRAELAAAEAAAEPADETTRDAEGHPTATGADAAPERA